MSVAPGPSPVSRVGGMVPKWGELHRVDNIEPEQLEQKILCVACVHDGDYTPPSTVVVVNGSSMCLPHASGTIGT